MNKQKANKVSHTKGPWKVNSEGNVATVHGDILVASPYQENARLIAAAPEMLEALKHVVAYLEKYKPNYCGLADDRACSPYRDAIEAIAKAEGE